MAEYLGSAGAGRLAVNLRRLPVEARKELRPQLRAAGELVRATAASNAGWSSKIPASLQVATSGSERRSAVAVVARRAMAPHARPYEGVTGNTQFRHPVFGRDVWVSQACRPFLRPAVVSEQRHVVDLIGFAVDRALTRTV